MEHTPVPTGKTAAMLELMFSLAKKEPGKKFLFVRPFPCNRTYDFENGSQIKIQDPQTIQGPDCDVLFVGRPSDQ